MKFTRKFAVVSMFAGLLVGSVGAGFAVNNATVAAQAAQQVPVAQVEPVESNTEDETQDPLYDGSILLDENAYENLSEADEAVALQDKALISADEAKAAAEAANPGSVATKVELDNENGVLVYSVELDSGQDVKVDAGDASILHTDQAGDDEAEADDDDDVEDENETENEADDANEGAEPNEVPAIP